MRRVVVGNRSAGKHVVAGTPASRGSRKRYNGSGAGGNTPGRWERQRGYRGENRQPRSRTSACPARRRWGVTVHRRDRRGRREKQCIPVEARTPEPFREASFHAGLFPDKIPVVRLRALRVLRGERLR